jgi:hypothetical protein
MEDPDMSPAWVRLLREHRKKLFGLTPSFLIGAMRDPAGSPASGEIGLCELRSMLECMRNHPVGTPVRILKCVQIQQPVVALDNSIGADEVPIAPIDCSNPRLFVAQRYFSGERRGLDGLAVTLWKTFERPINEGKFSYREDEFDTFDSDDLAFIKRALREGDS